MSLEPYRAGLVTACVEVGGAPRRWLFDTGAGMTMLSPRLADELGARPFGRMTGFRMSGERLDFPACDGVELAVGGVALGPRRVGVLDVGALMPPDWPQVDGVLALDALDALTVELSLARRTLGLGSVGAGPDEGWVEVEVQISRTVSGFSVVPFVAARAPGGHLWLELDSGNVDHTLLAPHAAALLGHEVEPGTRTPLGEVALDLVGLGPVRTEAVTREIIYDGVLGASFLRTHDVRLATSRGRAWLRPAPPRPPAPAPARSLPAPPGSR